MAGVIVLYQPDKDRHSRTYYTYGSVKDAIDGVKTLFEQMLRQYNPGVEAITYDIADIHRFVDGVPDLAILDLDPHTKQFKPLGKQAIKQLVYERIIQLQQGGGGRR